MVVAREHFAVNVAVAGGLLMLTHVGVGKYTVDEMLRKKDA
jgi:alanyl-tRNA synthetase